LRFSQPERASHKRHDSSKIGTSKAERYLVAHLKAALRKSDNSARTLAVATELDCFQGIADVVLGVYAGHRMLPGVSKRELQTLSFSTSKILAALHDKRRATFSRIAITSGLSLPKVKSELTLLQKMGILRIHRPGQIAVLRRIRVPFSEITAFEVKVKDWKSGIYQARNYKSFAHKVSVALPLARATRLTNNLPEFRRMKVGLVGIGPKGNIRWLLKPRRRRPISQPRHFHAALRLLKEL
jgi:hypothetical protein